MKHAPVSDHALLRYMERLIQAYMDGWRPDDWPRDDQNAKDRIRDLECALHSASGDVEAALSFAFIPKGVRKRLESLLVKIDTALGYEFHGRQEDEQNG